MIIKKLKGGSLSSTFLLKEKNRRIIRKEVLLTKNREYGFVRWYSQLKKIQKYNSFFPELYPKVLNVSYLKDKAYFDLEFCKTFTDIKTIFTKKELKPTQIKKINNALCKSFKIMHKYKFTAIKGLPLLYYKEEVLQKIFDAKKHKEFLNFYNINKFEYNGKTIYGINSYLPELKEFFNNLSLQHEEWIHGNPTLENTLYSFIEDRIIFVDPYEESIIDSRFLDYSQVMQCSNSGYGYINDRKISINRNAVSNNLALPLNFSNFNNLFKEQMLEKKTKNIVKIFEATQFIRMLPFKCNVGKYQKAKFFYVHACYMLNEIFK